MIRLRFDRAASLVSGTLYNSYHADKTFTGVSIDSRTLNAGELFVAIRGERLDGHEYVNSAIEQGAAGVVSQFDFVGLENITGQVPVIGVRNSHQALIELAHAYREQLDCTFIAITGSNGKTTTKELAARLFDAVEPRTYRSAGNLNNLYGMPLAIMRMPSDTRVAVIEAGISQPGEMKKLAALARADMVVMTNIGHSHLEFLKSLDDVAREKMHLIDHAAAEAPVIANADDAILMKHLKNINRRLVTFGLNDGEYRPDSISSAGLGSTEVVIEGQSFRLNLTGDHQVYNLLAAYAVVKTTGYNFDGIDTSGIGLSTAPLRGETVQAGGVTFVADCYNANPESMLAGLQTFFNLKTDQTRVLILGDMLELGKDQEKLHRQVGAALKDRAFDRALLVGRLAEVVAEGAVDAGVARGKLTCFAHVDDVLPSDKMPAAGELVYVKGSRGIGLEKIIRQYQTEGGAH